MDMCSSGRTISLPVPGLPPTWKTFKCQGICLKSQGICDKIPKVREFCCLKFIFSQVEDPNFENFLGDHVPRPPKWSRTHVELNLGLEKSGNFMLSGKWQPRVLKLVTE